MTGAVGKPYLIAEIGVNHNGDPARAAAMVKQSVAAGFDAVKFQHWIVEELLADSAPNAGYQGQGDQHQLLVGLRLEPAQIAELGRRCHDLGADFIVTADGRLALAEVLDMGVDILKVGSGDADNPWLLDDIIETRLPLIASTGMMSEDEVRVLARRLAGVHSLTILHCVTAYPTPISEANLPRMAALAAITGRPVGFSDHTLGVAAASAAVALGATVVEKHVTWSVSAPGPDHRASLELDQAREWTTGVRAAALAAHAHTPSAEEAANRAIVRKALYAARSLDAGAVIGLDDVAPLRPLDTYIPAGDRDAVVGRVLKRAIGPRQPLSWSDLE